MWLDFRSKNVRASGAAGGYLRRRLGLALGRFGSRVGRVAVYLADVNGPAGGEDKQCRMVASLPSAGSVIVEERGARLVALLDAAAGRLERAVARKLERRREHRRPATA